MQQIMNTKLSYKQKYHKVIKFNLIQAHTGIDKHKNVIYNASWDPCFNAASQKISKQKQITS